MKHVLFFAALGVALCSFAGTKPLVYHFDFNTTRLNRPTVEKILRHIAALGYTSVLWELENVVRLDSCPDVAAADAYFERRVSADS